MSLIDMWEDCKRGDWEREKTERAINEWEERERVTDRQREKEGGNSEIERDITWYTDKICWKLFLAYTAVAMWWILSSPPTI